MNNIIFLSQELLTFLRKNHYKESTLAKYERELKVLQRFCETHGTRDYTIELGNKYAEDIYIDGHFSAHRYFDRGRVTRLLNFYLDNGYFELVIKQRMKFDDPQIRFQNEYNNYKSYIYQKDLRNSTKHNYSYDVYMFLNYLSKTDLDHIDNLSIELIYSYLSTINVDSQRHALCGLRSYLLFINRIDLLQRIKGIRSPRTKKIISVLSDDENMRIQNVLNSDKVTIRDKAIFLLGYVLGMRACDIVTLKLTDINWENDCIQFIQSKTGNAVKLPLCTDIGNALFLYITLEREKSDCDNIFISHYPPYNSLVDHSACYQVVRKIMNLADIPMDNRFFGVHFLRHNTASSLVRSGVSLGTISAILGHSDPNSTNVYISTDSEKLKECVLSMKEIGMDGELYE